MRTCMLTIAAVLMTAGVGMFGSFTGLIASWILSPSKKDRQQDRDLALLRQQVAEIQQHLSDTLPTRKALPYQADFMRLQSAWTTLSEHVKSRILDEVNAASRKAA